MTSSARVALSYRQIDAQGDPPSFWNEDGTFKGCVVKFDGLANGKGVFVCSTLQEALTAIDRCFDEFA